MKTFNDTEIKEKRITNLKNFLEDSRIKIGEEIYGWIITQREIQERGGKKRVYVKAICPYCKKESNWIRYDGIQNHTVHSCGCSHESIGEQTIKELLEKNHIIFEQEKTFQGCISSEFKRSYRFDFYIPKENYIIEFDGKQHFEANNSYYTKDIVLKIQKKG